MTLLTKFDLTGRTVVVLGAHGTLGRLAMETVYELNGTAVGLDLDQINVVDLASLLRARERISDVHAAINCTVGNQAETFPTHAGFANDTAVGLAGAVNAMEAFKPSAGGAFVNVGSELSFKAPDPTRYESGFKPASYTAIKHGLIGLTKHYAAIWSKDHIRCNILCPGPINVGQKPPAHPFHRLAHPHEIKPAIAFLISDASSYMTGAELRIDGGTSVW